VKTNELLQALSRQGVTLWIDGHQLRYRAPQGAITPEIRSMLAEQKPAIMDLLRIAASDPVEVHPLSVGQQALWFIQQAAPNSGAYNVPFVARIHSALDVTALRSALQRLLDRHASLRSTFSIRDGAVVQEVHGRQTVCFEKVDARSWTSEELLERIKERRDRPFDLERGPLLKVYLYECATGDHILLLVIHHIVVDFWSLTVLLDELGQLYAAELRQADADLPTGQAEYSDFVAGQADLLSGQEGERLWDYWRTQLAGDLPTLEIVTDRPRPPVQTYRGGLHSFTIDPATTRALKELARSEATTLNTLLVAAFQVLLYRYSGQDEMLVGSLTAGRNQARFADVVGYFVNPVVMRTRCSGEVTFRQFLEQVRRVVLSAMEHQDYPFFRLIEKIQPNRDPSRSPLFQVMFVLQKTPRVPRALAFAMGQPGVRMSLAGLELESIGLEQHVARFDLDMMIAEDDGAMSGYLQYNADLFDAATVARMEGHFQVLLQGIVSDACERVGRLPILTPEETRRCVVDWNDTAAPVPELRIDELVAAQAARTPDGVAVRFLDRAMSYAELERRAVQLARLLQQAGARAETLVGISVSRSMDMLAAVLAVLKAGAAYVPLDPSLPRERLSVILQDAGIRLLLTERGLLSALPEHGANVLCVDEVAPVDVTAELGERPAGATPDDLAYVIYTSGSTGRPKGVQITHGGVVNFLASMRDRIGITDADVLVAVTTLSFDIAVLELLLPLTVGATVVIASREEVIDGTMLARRLVECGATMMQATPATWRMLVECGWQGGNRFKALCGGEALPRGLANQLLERCGSLWNLYGPTETTIWSSAGEVEPGDGVVELGPPIGNTQIYILDSTMQPVPIGVTGELYIGGAGLARGYHNLPVLTTERFVANPFDRRSGSRLYRTGDLARYRPGGRVEFLGRRDHQIKLRGFRIELGEIEAVLAQHPGVREAVTVLSERSADDKQLVSYVVRETKHTGTAEEISEWYAEWVAQWQSVWDEAYRRSATGQPSRFDITGWNSSYTGTPLPEEEMRDWLTWTTEDVLALSPKRVLEIGCGTGLVLFEVARHCEQYVGVDFSAEALRLIACQLTEQERRKVVLRQMAAEDIGRLEDRGFDVVIINSVVQYFPSATYLSRVLRAAIEVTRPGGVIYVGDVRSLPLLEAFRAGVELRRAPDSLTVDQLRARIRESIVQTEELALCPDFFRSLEGLYSQIDHVEIRPKRGRYPNEMTRFRYQVFIHLKSEERRRIRAPWIDWRVERPAARDIRKLLAANQAEALALRDVANARLSLEAKLVTVLQDAPSNQTVGALRSALGGMPEDGVDPEDLQILGGELGYRVDIGWGRHGAEGRFDVVFVRAGAGRDVTRIDGTEDAALAGMAAPRARANNPLEARYRRLLMADLRGHLQRQLPDYMVPSAIMFVDAMPLTPNGKVDRQALARLRDARVTPAALYEAPRSELEQTIASIWQEMLRVERVGLDDNFFDLGGHSLLVVQMRNRIRASLGRDLPVTAFFQFPTVRALAGHLGGARHDDGTTAARDRAEMRKVLARRTREVREQHRRPRGQ